jgi:6-phosphogluconate dehydrogenase
MAAGQSFGVFGLDVMGRNLALNIARNGFSVAVYNRTWAKTEQFMRELAPENIRAAGTVAEFVALLERPRRILIMVKAGQAVDAVLAELTPRLAPGDVVVDGGNSLFTDTERRALELAPTGIEFFGMGVSGGEHGALWGPSMMPGGDPEAYRHLEPILTRIAASTPDDGPCVTWIGYRGAGHFVKMVHNGIEYADMQLIAETYDLLRNVAGLDNRATKEVFERYDEGELQSYLIEITAKVLDVPDPEGTGEDLVDVIVDEAEQKGTGKWTVQTALDLGVAIPTIAAAVDARLLSARKNERMAAARLLPGPARRPPEAEPRAFVEDLGRALYCSKVCSYAQGMAMIAAANERFGYAIRLDEIARIWKGGCIIRASLLNDIKEAFREDPRVPNLLIAARFRGYLAAHQDAWRRTVEAAVRTGVAIPALSASMAYYDSYRRERLPANLIQAQRDFFGAHTYRRVDRPGSFHTDWSAAEPQESGSGDAARGRG